MLACARIGAVHSVVFGGFSPESLAGRIADCASTLVITADEGVRGGKKIPLKANVDAAIASHGLPVQERRRREPHRRGRRLGRRPRPALRGDHGRGIRRLRAGADERRGPAVHPLHVGLDRQAEGRAAHGRRLPGVRELHLRLRLRLPRRRRLLVHRRRRLGHRAQLYRVRPAVERRDEPDVRGRAELPGHLALLARRRQAPGHHLLHRADRDPRADARRRRAGEGDLAQEPAPARLGRRADQPGSLGVVSPRRRRRTLPGRGHLVADRDRRHPDLAAARRDRAEGRLGDAAAAGHPARARRRPRQDPRGRRRRQPCPARQLARPDAHRLRRPRSLHPHLFHALSAGATSPATARAATRTATGGSRAAWTTS